MSPRDGFIIIATLETLLTTWPKSKEKIYFPVSDISYIGLDYVLVWYRLPITGSECSLA